MKILEDYVVPVARFTESGDKFRFETLHGTAFFINSDGIFLTAGHVWRNAQADQEEKGGQIGLIVRDPANSQFRFIGQILNAELADAPYDIAIGVIDKPSRSCFALMNTEKIWIWENVHTVGYPESALTQNVESVTLSARGHKGYVVRKVGKGKQLIHEHPDAFEINFAIPKGMSGAPLVLRYDEPIEPDAPFPLLGICIGNQPVELVDFAVDLIEEDGSRFKETKVRIEEYGIAHDLWSLADWKPECLGQTRLIDAFRPSTIL